MNIIAFLLAAGFILLAIAMSHSILGQPTPRSDRITGWITVAALFCFVGGIVLIFL